MKSFKIKKRDQRQQVFIIGKPLSFSKPHFKCSFFKEIHPPLFKKPNFSYEIVVQETIEQVDSVAAQLPDSSHREWNAVRDFVAAQQDFDPEH